MKARVLIPALLLGLVYAQAWAGQSSGWSNKYLCTHIFELRSPLTNLGQGLLERSLPWVAFAKAPDETLAKTLQIEQFMSFNENPHIMVDVFNGKDLIIVSCESLTISPRNLSELKNRILASDPTITQSARQIAAVNENYQLAVDKMSECSQAPISPQHSLYPLFRHGFQIFTGKRTAFFLSGELRWLALCPAEGAAVDLKALREDTFRFMTDPSVTRLLNCEERLISLKNRK